MPANVQPNGNCELDSPAITLAGTRAQIVANRPMVDGARVVRLGYATTPGTETGQATWPDCTVENTTTYDISFWLRNEGDTNGGPLRVQMDRGGGLFETLVDVAVAGYPDDGDYQKVTTEFESIGTTAKFRLLTQPSGELLQAQWWNIDAVRIEKRDDAMAIKLAERGVAAVVSLLQSNLGTELTAIDTDRADSITMDAPANSEYYTYPRPEIAGATCHVEVFEQEFTSFNFYTDADAERAVYALPVTIRLTHFNRANYSAADMVTRSRRYATGVFNTFLKTPLIDAADAAIQIGAIETTTPIWEVDGEDENKIIKTQVTLTAELRCEESYS